MDCRVDHGSKVVEVKLSRRNLASMLHKLDHMGDSALTIFRDMDDGWRLIFRGEHDETHYGDRKPGPMHPATERGVQSDQISAGGFEG